MRSVLSLVFFLLLLLPLSVFPQASGDEFAKANELFKKANELLEKKDFAAALTNYQAALKILPDEPALLYNGGFAAMLANDDATAVELWKRLKKLDPTDWQVKAKLTQAYQRLSKVAERDAERSELVALWKQGVDPDLKKQVQFGRDRFEAGGKSVLAFELFEFKGPRGIRYVFSIMDDMGSEEYRISLGSYDMTNAIWRETTKPTPKNGVRLFHLDGYFKNGGHATYGMFPGEPSYEDTKKKVIDILEKKRKPVSATIPAQEPKPEPKKDNN